MSWSVVTQVTTVEGWERDKWGGRDTARNERRAWERGKRRNSQQGGMGDELGTLGFFY